MSNTKNNLMIAWEQSASSSTHLSSKGNETVTNPKKIASLFNEYFSRIAKKKTKVKLKF